MSMKTVTDIIREIIGGLMPRSDTGFIMALISLDMVYDWRC